MKQLIIEIIEILNGGRNDLAVTIADIKDNAGHSINQHLIELHNAGTITMMPRSNQRAITAADRAAAVAICGEDQHLIVIG